MSEKQPVANGIYYNSNAVDKVMNLVNPNNPDYKNQTDQVTATSQFTPSIKSRKNKGSAKFFVVSKSKIVFTTHFTTVFRSISIFKT